MNLTETICLNLVVSLYYWSTKNSKTKFLDNFHIYSPLGRHGKTPSPCGNPENIYVTKKNGYFFINKITNNWIWSNLNLFKISKQKF